MSHGELLQAAELRHALRTPLNHIIGYCEILLEEAQDVSPSHLQALVAEARELTRLIQSAFQQGGESVSESELGQLQASLLPSVQRMTASVQALSTGSPPHAEGDLAKVRFAVGRLLDFAANQPGAVLALAESIPLEPQTATQGSGGQLLVVDDNAENRDILRRHLQSQGYGVSTAEDGPEALAMLATGTFDLLLLDVLMPRMDGFQVLREMKQNPELRAMPVIMISALDENDSVVRCIQLGAEDYLTKPFDPILLSARIGASLEKKRLRDEERRRARELQQLLDQLRRTQDQLLVQENLASLGALTAGIAHEIKNPLNFINNFAAASQELVEEIREQMSKGDATAAGALFDQLEKCVEKIEEHGKRADRIVRGMLMHSRGKSGDPEVVDLKCLLLDAVNLVFHAMRAQDSAFNTRIETSFDPQTGTIRAVSQDISRVFLNILNNAVYAVWERKRRDGDAYEPEVRVSTRSLEGAVEITVRDNGTGIPPEVLAKIFNPFFTTKPAGAGTGLGLSLSHEIVVRGHSGTIRAESVSGAGTEFIVTLPRGINIDGKPHLGGG